MANRGQSGIEGDGLGNEGPVELRLSGGETIRVHPISYRLYQAIENRYRVPEPPTRAVPTIDGGTENIPDPQNLEYVKQVGEIAEAKATALIRLVAAQSLPEIKVDREGEWLQVVQLIEPDYQPPEDAVQLKVDYLQYWLIRSRADWELLMMAAVAAMAVGGRDIEKAMAGFRNQISREAGKALFDAIAPDNLQSQPGNDTDGEVGGGAVDGVPQPSQGGQGGIDGGEASGGPGGMAGE